VWFYSVFDSALYRNLDTEWLFFKKKATLHNLQTPTHESKTLEWVKESS